MSGTTTVPSQVSGFVQQYLPYAQQVSQQTGLPVAFVLGQAGWESGWGYSNAAANNNNFFGISPGGQLASYGSPAAGFQAYSGLINSQYPGAASGGSPLAIAQNLVAGGYNSADPNYASNVAGATSLVQQVLGGGTGGLWLPGGGPFAGSGTGGLSLPGIPGFGQGSGQGGSVLSWIGELGIRAMLIVVGLVLVVGGFYLAGRPIAPDVRISQ